MAPEGPEETGTQLSATRELGNARQTLKDLLRADREATEEMVELAVFFGLFHLRARIEQMQAEGFDHIGLPELLVLIDDTATGIPEKL